MSYLFWWLLLTTKKTKTWILISNRHKHVEMHQLQFWTSVSKPSTTSSKEHILRGKGESNKPAKDLGVTKETWMQPAKESLFLRATTRIQSTKLENSGKERRLKIRI